MHIKKHVTAEMTKNSKFSFGEGEVLDVKPESNFSQTDIIDFSNVRIGGSAGGLGALELFFVNMPINTRMAYVVIQHLDSTHIGVMPELLLRMTKI